METTTKMKAVAIQENAHLVPQRFWDMLVTNDDKVIKKYERLWAKDLTEEQIKKIEGKPGVYCYGDLFY